MEFHEKLQELRKSKGMTQEELAAELFVSRTAISKWEQGRGYPGLDSLKEISGFFSVTIDDLLSGEVLLSIAEKDSSQKMRKLYDLLLGLADLFSLALILLPLYPETAGDYVYSVNLAAYGASAPSHIWIYWAMFIAFIAMGVAKLLLLKLKPEKSTRMISDASVVLNIAGLIFLAISREAYATVMLVMMLTVKMVLLLKAAKVG